MIWLPLLFLSPAVFSSSFCTATGNRFEIGWSVFTGASEKLGSVFSVQFSVHGNVGKRSRVELTGPALMARGQKGGNSFVLCCLDVLPNSTEAEGKKKPAVLGSGACPCSRRVTDWCGFGTVLVYVLIRVWVRNTSCSCRNMIMQKKVHTHPTFGWSFKYWCSVFKFSCCSEWFRATSLYLSVVVMRRVKLSFDKLHSPNPTRLSFCQPYYYFIVQIQRIWKVYTPLLKRQDFGLKNLKPR